MPGHETGATMRRARSSKRYPKDTFSLRKGLRLLCQSTRLVPRCGERGLSGGIPKIHSASEKAHNLYARARDTCHNAESEVHLKVSQQSGQPSEGATTSMPGHKTDATTMREAWQGYAAESKYTGIYGSIVLHLTLS